MEVFEVVVEETKTAVVYVVADSAEAARKHINNLEGTYLMSEIFQGIDKAYVDHKVNFVESVDVDTVKSYPDNLLLTLDDDLKYPEDITDEDLE